MISQETIDQVRTASDIVDVINGYVRLKKRGRSFIACCPFHSEKTPSFTVSIEKQFYHCFGCSQGGNVYTFLMEHEKMSFTESVRFLAARAGIAIKESGSDYKRDEFDRLYYANQVALDYFQLQLKAPKYKRVLNDYLIGKRELKPETIEQFQLGLAGEEWDGLIKYAAKKDLHSETLEKAGLVIKSDKSGKYFDRFRQRLMIPIFNLSRKPIAFGGRTLKKGEPAKYINSPQTPLYSKSNVLYGLNFSRDTLRRMDYVYVVEGYFDVISLAQAGINNVVASSGTAFTPQQARLLARFVDEAYLFFDADSAGQKAAIRSVDILYDAGLEVKIIRAPEGEDPDSVARTEGRNRIEELKEGAVDFIDYRTHDLQLKESGIIAKEKLIKEFLEIGHKINDRTRRSLFFDSAASTLGVNRQLFDLTGPKQAKVNPTGLPPKIQHQIRIEQELLSLLLCNPTSASRAYESISPGDFDSNKLAELYSAMFNQYKVLGEVIVNSLIEEMTNPESASLLTELAAKEWPDDKIDSETNERLRLITEAAKKRVRERLRQELAEAEANRDQKRADEIIKELRQHGLGD